MNKENKGYARNLKSRHIQLIALGGTIGTGLFLGSGKSIHLAGPSIVLAYCITRAYTHQFFFASWFVAYISPIH